MTRPIGMPMSEDPITSDNRFIEVILRWRGRVTDVKRVPVNTAFRVGTDKGCDLFVAGNSGCWNLLTSSPDTGISVHFNHGMTGTVTRAGQMLPVSAWSLSSSSGAFAGGDVRAVPLRDDTVVSIDLGDHALQVRAVAKSRVVPVAAFFDALWANAALITLCASSVLVAMMLLYPVGMDTLDDDLLTDPTRYQALLFKPAPNDNTFLIGLKARQQAAVSNAVKAGSAKTDVRDDHGKSASVAKHKPSDEQVVASTLARLFGTTGVASVFDGDASGGALAAALNGLDGPRVAAAFGAGGPRLRDGDSVDGIGVGTLGSGAIATRGRATGDGSYGAGGGGLDSRPEREIVVTAEPPVIIGTLDPAIIRRIVREHAGQVRYCYESALARTPGLHGKVVMKWAINSDGRVTQATTAETQMNNATVESCLSSRVKSWVFPPPRGGGIVIVTYPFVFKQAG